MSGKSTKNGNRKIHSLNREITVIFVAIMALTIGACILINTFFLEKVYVRDKQNTLMSVYTKLNSLTELTEADEDEFTAISGTHNVGIGLYIVMRDPFMDTWVFNPVKIISYEPDVIMVNELRRIFSRELKGKILVENDDYKIFQTTDGAGTTEYLEMIASLSNGQFMLLRTPLESIRVSSQIANRFLLYVGLGGILISAVAIFIFTKKISKPILSLASISERVSEMDFEARYNGKEKTEIAVLGESINKMSDNLEKAFNDLKTANAELQKDNELKTKIDNMRKEFISNVSHELKTPIALIQGYAEGLKEGISEESERDYYCDVIMDESAKMNTMVKKLLDLNQLEWGEDVLNTEVFDVCELVRNQVASFDIITRQNDIKVTVSGVNKCFVNADEFKIEEVFKNYFSNACNHVKGECGKRIDVSVQKEENEVKISVFNTGDKIPDESLPHLFEKFYKVDKARTREYGGSGVGLSIVKAIMEAHHKDFGVYNADEGVCFWFKLDCADTEEA
ncbi:MAG: HAMP domain-containing protein [Lachnospiraceae bacterium]|nr:HAMP domain-containing protein [Lachnospiraceae bacterium]